MNTYKALESTGAIDKHRVYYNVETASQAWEIAHSLVIGLVKDSDSTQRAGYPIYRNPDGEFYSYVCDLGDRLEVNMADNSTVNIWIGRADLESSIQPEPQAQNISDLPRIDLDKLDALYEKGF